MKIAMISSGNSIHVKKIANALIERGHTITLFTLPNHNKLLSDFDKRINIIKLPVSGSKGYILNAPYIRYYLSKHPVDLINSHYASGYGTLARFVGKHPLALAVFGTDVFEYPYKSRFNMHNIIKNLDFADVITSTSHVMEKEVRKFYKNKRPIYITPFGVDLEKFRPIKVTKDDTFEFGIVKKIEPQYGIDLLLYAYQMFLQKYPTAKTRLVIYGFGSELENYKKLANKLDIYKNVEFKGYIQNELVPKVLNHMDVVCFPSVVNESFGVAVVESMACGIPVIASDAAGFTEVIEDGITGLIIPKKDLNALSNAMKTMFEMDKEKRKMMGYAGVKRVSEMFNFKKNMICYENALINAVKGFYI